MSVDPAYKGWFDFEIYYCSDGWWVRDFISDDSLVDQTKLKNMVDHIIDTMEKGDKEFPYESCFVLLKNDMFLKRIALSQNALTSLLAPVLQDIVFSYLIAEDEEFSKTAIVPFPIFNILDPILGSYIKQFFPSTDPLEGLFHPSNGNFVLQLESEIKETSSILAYSGWFKFRISYDHDLWWHFDFDSTDPLVFPSKLARLLSHIIDNIERGNKSYSQQPPHDFVLSKNVMHSKRLETSGGALKDLLVQEFQNLVFSYLAAELETETTDSPNLDSITSKVTEVVSLDRIPLESVIIGDNSGGTRPPGVTSSSSALFTVTTADKASPSGRQSIPNKKLLTIEDKPISVEPVASSTVPSNAEKTNTDAKVWQTNSKTQSSYKIKTLKEIKAYYKNYPKLIKMLNRLEKGSQSSNPYWMNSTQKLNNTVNALNAIIKESASLKGALKDPQSELFKALNHQRISFFKPITKSMKLAQLDINLPRV